MENEKPTTLVINLPSADEKLLRVLLRPPRWLWVRNCAITVNINIGVPLRDADRQSMKPPSS